MPVGPAPGGQQRGDTGASVARGLPPAAPAQAGAGGVTGRMLSGVHVASHQEEKSPGPVTDGRHYGLAELDPSGIAQIN